MIGRVPLATQNEMEAAVKSCERAFPAWSETSILNRQQIFLRYQQLIKDHLVGAGAVLPPVPPRAALSLQLTSLSVFTSLSERAGWSDHTGAGEDAC